MRGFSGLRDRGSRKFKMIFVAEFILVIFVRVIVFELCVEVFWGVIVYF